MADSKKYWKGLEQLNETSEFIEASGKEFSEEIPVEEFLGDENFMKIFLQHLGTPQIELY